VRVGVFGGMFNPPHVGHLVFAQEGRVQLDLDEVWLMPTGTPSHKEVADPGADVRLELCRRAIEGQPGLVASDVEVNRRGASYTVDTLRELTVSSPNHEFTLIVGADQALSLGEWREPHEIGGLATIAVADRGDSSRDDVQAEVVKACDTDPLFVDMPRVDVSSTLVRERLAAGETIRHLVPRGVAEMVEQEGLYR
jgi:nicotinate-nucleotide adenylyltransferase